MPLSDIIKLIVLISLIIALIYTVVRICYICSDSYYESEEFKRKVRNGDIWKEL